MLTDSREDCKHSTLTLTSSASDAEHVEDSDHGHQNALAFVTVSATGLP